MAIRVFKLTPGRCSSCGRFVPHDDPPVVWTVRVSETCQQLPGKWNIYARTRCRDCAGQFAGSSSHHRSATWGEAEQRAEAMT